MQIEEGDTSDSWRLSVFLSFFFFSFAPLRRTRNALLLDLLITKRDIICCIYIFFFFWSGCRGCVFICGYLFGTMGDSVFLDRQNSYLVSTGGLLGP